MTTPNIDTILPALLPQQTWASLTETVGAADFSSSLAIRAAALQAQSVSTLITSLFAPRENGKAPGNATPASISALLETLSTSRSLVTPTLSTDSILNFVAAQGTRYCAQRSELSEMKSALPGLRNAGHDLAAIGSDIDCKDLRTTVHRFVERYNAWIDRFSGSVEAGGVLAGTQAAEISLNELQQSIGNVLNGAKSGLRGLGALGLNIDPTTHRLKLDESRLDACLEKTCTGTLDTLREFGENFARSAELLNANDNFIAHRLENLQRVIDYIADNRPQWQAESGVSGTI